MRTSVSLIGLIFGMLVLGGLGIPFGSLEGSASDIEKISGEDLAQATFAGGCFWCMEPPFEKIEGVVSVTAGYTGGHTKNPSYEEVSAGNTGHVEAVQISFDPKKVSYPELLEVFWHNVDPVAQNGQFCDQGPQYRTAIFYHSPSQKRLAERSRSALERSGRFQRPIATEISPASAFYIAEEYHQNFYRRHPLRYKIYRLLCGRDRRLEEIWGEHSAE